MKAIVTQCFLIALLFSANLPAQGTVFKVCHDPNMPSPSEHFNSFLLKRSVDNCDGVHAGHTAPPVMYLADKFYVDAGNDKVRAEIGDEVKKQLTAAIEAKLDSKVTEHLAKLTAQEAMTRLKRDYDKKINELVKTVATLQSRLDKMQGSGAK